MADMDGDNKIDFQELLAIGGDSSGGGSTRERRGSLLFVDEIHRWNKAQQDALVPHVEEGTIVLVGATMPNAGTKNMQEHVTRLFPLAKWCRTDRLHRARAWRRRGRSRPRPRGTCCGCPTTLPIKGTFMDLAGHP